MEKDKLMELINTIVDERKSIENEIKKQTENKVLRGLTLMKQCLEYANEMKPYFDKINCNPKGVYICGGGCISRPISWIYGKNKKFCFEYECSISRYFYLDDFNEEYINNYIKHSEECTISFMARLLIDYDYTFEKFKTELNEMLANEIMLYKKKNNEMANK